jgi:hypothetical protein
VSEANGSDHGSHPQWPIVYKPFFARSPDWIGGVSVSVERRELDVDVDAQEEPCRRCGDGPREELVKVSVRDVVWVSEVCRPCAREASQFMQGKA